ncbi:hypothetical protein TMUPMC115_2316 [Tetragenococcus muriaticus PMC-11-5]|uniref:Uncharacterized protein n=1 Tax=Tetragenococcus muriaticus PMC-11-5 TaxID=1302649 RepID=A0A091BYV5_9ENTE|nr:hypothetical protein [Tetragenococcus muriaticus]KFN89665.1 hypothetical protein TMUPMC115_2316 [Tetragenococcus muriaticus PMC-11-5]
MKANEIIRENTTLQQFLTKDNAYYYGHLVIYIRSMSLFRDEQKSEQLLLEILQDILEAQKHGISAEAYFGKNPKQIADEMIRHLPMNLRDTLAFNFHGLGVLLLFTLLPELTLPNNGFDIGTFLIFSIYTISLVLFIVYLLGMSIYHYHSMRTKIISGILIALGIAIGISLQFFVTTPWTIALDGRLGILVIGLTVIALAYLFFKSEDKKLWGAFIPFVLLSAISGILIRINNLYPFLNTETLQVGIAVFLVLGLLIHFTLSIRNARKR